MPLIQLRSSSIIPSVDLKGTPTAPTAPQGTNNSQIASTAFVTTAISGLVDSAPSMLNTLAELAASISNDGKQN